MMVVVGILLTPCSSLILLSWLSCQRPKWLPLRWMWRPRRSRMASWPCTSVRLLWYSACRNTNQKTKKTKTKKRGREWERGEKRREMRREVRREGREYWDYHPIFLGGYGMVSKNKASAQSSIKISLPSPMSIYFYFCMWAYFSSKIFFICPLFFVSLLLFHSIPFIAFLFISFFSFITFIYHFHFLYIYICKRLFLP